MGTHVLHEATRRGDKTLRYVNDDESVVLHIDNDGGPMTAEVTVTITPGGGGTVARHLTTDGGM